MRLKLLAFSLLLLGACDDGPDLRDYYDGTHALARFNDAALPAYIGDIEGDSSFVTSGTLDIHSRRYTLTVRWRINQLYESGWTEAGAVILDNGLAKLDPDQPDQTDRPLVRADSLVRVYDHDHGFDYDFR
jgi:hypothetical protein